LVLGTEANGIWRANAASAGRVASPGAPPAALVRCCGQKVLRASPGGSVFLPPDEGAPDHGDLIADPDLPRPYPRFVPQNSAAAGGENGAISCLAASW